MASCLSRDNDPSNPSSHPKLHLITYLCPDFPLELFQTYQHYLEEVLACESYLIVESRWGAPPAGKTDPFTANEVDIGKILLVSLELRIETLLLSLLVDFLYTRMAPGYYRQDFFDGVTCGHSCCCPLILPIRRKVAP